MRAVITAGLIGLLAVSAFAADPPPRTISTTGNAVIEVVPDEVTLSLGVQTFDRDLDTAKDQNDKNSQSLLAAIKAAGVDDKDVQVANMNVEIDYDRNGVNEQLQGYRTSRWYTVKLHEPKKLMDLVDTGIKNGANQIGSFQYDSTQLRTFRDQARSMAAQAAKQKAEALAGDLGCTVGLPMTINEQNNDVSPMYYNNTRAAGFGGGGGFGVGGDTMPSGQMSIQATVDVTFELKDIIQPR